MPRKQIFDDLFQSTLSVRRATVVLPADLLVDDISIHALREESDLPLTVITVPLSISIHALREESDTITKVLQNG